jgi:hypothetical protein
MPRDYESTDLESAARLARDYDLPAEPDIPMPDEYEDLDKPEVGRDDARPRRTDRA